MLPKTCGVYCIYTILLLGCAMDGQGQNGAAAPKTADEFSWLEDRNGHRALDWVRNQNERTERVLAKDSRFKAYYDEALAVLRNQDALDQNRGVKDLQLIDQWVYG